MRGSKGRSDSDFLDFAHADFVVAAVGDQVCG
jgi:hypothetical protein